MATNEQKPKKWWTPLLACIISGVVFVIIVAVLAWWEISDFYANATQPGFAFPIFTFVVASMLFIVWLVITIVSCVFAYKRRKYQNSLEALYAQPGYTTGASAIQNAPDQPKRKYPWYTNIIVVVITSLLMTNGMLELSGRGLAAAYLGGIIPSYDVYLLLTFVAFALSAIVCLIYIRLTKKDVLKAFVRGGFSKSIKCLGIGLLVGFGLNAALIAIGASTQSLIFEFQGGSLILIPFCIAMLIQSSTEELLTRGYVVEYVSVRHSRYFAGVVAAVVFMLFHVGNILVYGFNAVFLLNVLLVGIFLFLLMELAGSIWIAFGMHAAWNYTQQCIFGLSNSGYQQAGTVFRNIYVHNSFYYNTAFGIEGCLMCTVVLLIAIVVAIILLKKRTGKDGSC